jgi:hypothetical protein
MGREAVPSIPTLIAALSYENPHEYHRHGLRISAIYALTSLGPLAKDALPELRRLAETVPEVKIPAEGAIAKIEGTATW